MSLFMIMIPCELTFYVSLFPPETWIRKTFAM